MSPSLTARLITLPVDIGSLESLVNDGRRIDQPLLVNNYLNLPVMLIGHDAKGMKKFKISAFGVIGTAGEMALRLELAGLPTLAKIDVFPPPAASMYQAREDEGEVVSTSPHLWLLTDSEPNSDFSVFVDPDAGKALGLVLGKDGAGDLIITLKVIDAPVGFQDVFDKRTGMMVGSTLT